MNRQQLLEIYNKTISNFGEMKNQGAIDENQYNQYLENAKAEFNQYMDQMEGGGEPPAQGDQYEMDLNEISRSDVLSNRFGAAILELGYEIGYNSVEELIVDISEQTGNDVEDIAGVLTGQNLPDESFVLTIIDYFELEEEDGEDIYEAAVEAHRDYAEMLSEAGGLEEDQEPQFNQKNEYMNNANFQQNNSDHRVQELEQQLAQFQAEKQISDSLQSRMNTAEKLVNNGDMPPAIYTLLFGNFENQNEQIAAFNKQSEMNNVSMESEFHAIDKTLDIFEKMNLGASGMFQAIVSEQEAENEAQFEQDEDRKIENIARRNVEARKNR